MTQLLDGGLATTLQARGLAPHTTVNDWLREQPQHITDAHRAFRAAGSACLLAGSFTAVDDPRLVALAVKLAVQAGAGTEVFASFAPLAVPGASQPVDPYLRAVDVALLEGAAGVVLETFVDPGSLTDLVRALRKERPTVQLIASFCPADDARLFSGAPTAGWARRLHEAGADGVGANCGTGPVSILAALSDADPAWQLWAKPNTAGLDPLVFAQLLAPSLSTFAWVGGCCGASPAHISALHATLSR